MKFQDTETFQAFQKMSEVTFAPGALSTREKELVALGIAVALRCEGCIRHHLAACLDSGASREEAGEAIAVGAEMGGGPATTAASLAFGLLYPD